MNYRKIAIKTLSLLFVMGLATSLASCQGGGGGDQGGETTPTESPSPAEGGTSQP